MRERAESGKEGKGSPTLFIAFVLVEGFISKYLKSHVYGKRQIEKFSSRNEHIKTAQTILMYKTGVNLLISVQLK